MRRTEQLQGLRLMKFEEIYGRSYRGELSQLEAAEILGVSERTFRRWWDRFEAEGAAGLYDRRLGRVSRMWTWWVRRSEPKISAHSSNGKLEVMIPVFSSTLFR